MSPDVAELMRQLGHTSAQVIGPSRRGRFKVTCDCGYESASRTTHQLALEALVGHLGGVMKRHRESGVSVPPSTGRRL